MGTFVQCNATGSVIRTSVAICMIKFVCGGSFPTAQDKKNLLHLYKKTESGWKREQVSLIPLPTHISPARAEIHFCRPSFWSQSHFSGGLPFCSLRELISVGPRGLLSVSVYSCRELMLYLSPTLILNKIAQLLVQRHNFDVALACGRTHLLRMVL